MNSLGLLQINIRSVHKNFSSLLVLLESLKVKPNFISIAESSIKNSCSHLFNMPGYNLIAAERANRKGGGIILYLRKEIKYKNRSDIIKFANDACQLLAIETLHEKPENSIVIISVYRPPNTIFASFLQVITNILELIFDVKKINKRIIITGDFNLDLLKRDCDSRVSQFCNIINSFGLYSVVTQATRIVGNTATLLDNIFINFAEQPRYLGILFDDLSDHLPVYLRFQAQYDCAKQYHSGGG